MLFPSLHINIFDLNHVHMELEQKECDKEIPKACQNITLRKRREKMAMTDTKRWYLLRLRWKMTDGISPNISSLVGLNLLLLISKTVHINKMYVWD